VTTVALATLFSAADRRRELTRLQRTIGEDFGIEFIAMDVTDERSVAAVAEQFADACVNGSAAEGRRFALGVAENEMIVGEDMAPVAALAATGARTGGGASRRLALIAFNARNNHVLRRAFGDLRPLFGAKELRQIERMTLLHEAAHMVVHHAEQAGTEAWSQAVATLDEPAGSAGDAIRRWAESSEGAIAYPGVRDLLLAEADLLDLLQARTRAGEAGLCYDADALRQSYQALKERPDYRNFQEHMGDAFMVIALRRDGIEVTAMVAEARARGDAEHNTQASLAAIGALPRESVLGKDTRQLMECAAAVVRQALRLGQPQGLSESNLDRIQRETPPAVRARMAATASPRPLGDQSGGK